MRKLTRIKVPRAKHGYKIKCNICGHIWFPKLKTSYECPRCRSKL